MVKENKNKDGLRSLKDFEEYVDKNGFAPNLTEMIGENASKEFVQIIGESIEGMTWIDVVEILKKKYNLTGFQSGILLGFCIAFQAAIGQIQNIINT